jgi:ketosteroid isomerase-like protein
MEAFSEYLEGVNEESVMATSGLERVLDDWAIAWSSNGSSDPERVLALFADDCVFEDVTFGVVARGKQVGLLPSQ